MKKIILILFILINKISVVQNYYGSINYQLKVNNDNFKFPIKLLKIKKASEN